MTIKVDHILLVIISLLALFSTFLVQYNYMEASRMGGFHCWDQASVNLAYQQSTIPTSWVYGIAFLFPLGFIILTEIKNSVEFKIQLTTVRVWVTFSCYLFGLLAHLIVVYGLKLCIGRLRPDFLSICKPRAI
jgi:hypothetical protein